MRGSEGSAVGSHDVFSWLSALTIARVSFVPPPGFSTLADKEGLVETGCCGNLVSETTRLEIGSKKPTCTWVRTETQGLEGNGEIVASGRLRRHDSGKQGNMQYHRLSEA